MGLNQSIHCDVALIEGQWRQDIVLTVQDEWITAIESAPSKNDLTEHVAGVVIPGIPNVHSHAFQRGFAGLTESRTVGQDTFWTWRRQMYDFVSRLTPEMIYQIALQLYTEMLAAGYTWVGEFHYVHRTPEGHYYPDPAELADAVTRAAIDSGIGICLLPTVYQRGGFDQPLLPEQRRFELDRDTLFEILETMETRYGEHPGFCSGLGLHSLRAVEIATAIEIVEAFGGRYPDRPIHIHVAEQIGEQQQCLKVHGVTPVTRLMQHFDVDRNWCLIHATHADDAERLMILEAGAVVGLCPTTEANLGDGIFEIEAFSGQGGRFAIGSDSHISVSAAAELRMLEYGQRLTKHRRAILCDEQYSVGRTLIHSVTSGGAQSLGIKTGSLAVGCRADLVVLEPGFSLDGKPHPDQVLDQFVFCEHQNPVAATMVSGKWRYRRAS